MFSLVILQIKERSFNKRNMRRIWCGVSQTKVVNTSVTNPVNNHKQKRTQSLSAFNLNNFISNDLWRDNRLLTIIRKLIDTQTTIN